MKYKQAIWIGEGELISGVGITKSGRMVFLNATDCPPDIRAQLDNPGSVTRYDRIKAEKRAKTRALKREVKRRVEADVELATRLSRSPVDAQR